MRLPVNELTQLDQEILIAKETLRLSLLEMVHHIDTYPTEHIPSELRDEVDDAMETLEDLQEVQAYGDDALDDEELDDIEDAELERRFMDSMLTDAETEELDALDDLNEAEAYTPANVDTDLDFGGDFNAADELGHQEIDHDYETRAYERSSID